MPERVYSWLVQLNLHVITALAMMVSSDASFTISWWIGFTWAGWASQIQLSIVNKNAKCSNDKLKWGVPPTYQALIPCFILRKFLKISELYAYLACMPIALGCGLNFAHACQHSAGWSCRLCKLTLETTPYADLSVCLSVCLSDCLSNCLSVCYDPDTRPTSTTRRWITKSCFTGSRPRQTSTMMNHVVDVGYGMEGCEQMAVTAK